jgi:hypothetical protein
MPATTSRRQGHIHKHRRQGHIHKHRRQGHIHKQGHSHKHPHGPGARTCSRAHVGAKGARLAAAQRAVHTRGRAGRGVRCGRGTHGAAGGASRAEPAHLSQRHRRRATRGGHHNWSRSSSVHSETAHRGWPDARPTSPREPDARSRSRVARTGTPTPQPPPPPTPNQRHHGHHNTHAHPALEQGPSTYRPAGHKAAVAEVDASAHEYPGCTPPANHGTDIQRYAHASSVQRSQARHAANRAPTAVPAHLTLPTAARRGQPTAVAKQARGAVRAGAHPANAVLARGADGRRRIRGTSSARVARRARTGALIRGLQRGGACKGHTSRHNTRNVGRGPGTSTCDAKRAPAQGRQGRRPHHRTRTETPGGTRAAAARPRPAPLAGGAHAGGGVGGPRRARVARCAAAGACRRCGASTAPPARGTLPHARRGDLQWYVTCNRPDTMGTSAGARESHA